MTSSAYLNSIKSGAIEGWHTHQIAPSITGAQAALESGWGTSSLAKPPYNNNFGIKASADWSGRTVTMPTREWLNGSYVTVNASFRAYDSIADSVRDHAAFFTNTDWRKENYKHVVGERDYKASARALQNAGYATDPSYATKLINIIEQYQLFKWDTEAYSGITQPTESTRPTISPQPQSKVVGKELSNAGREYVKSASISVIGDSLGVGTKPYLEQLIPNSNYDVIGSRQITHTQASLNATTTLRNMLNAGTLKNTVVVIIGTNRGVTQREVESFADIAGTSRKILFVDTASQVNHAPEVSRVYKNVASIRSNVFYVNWRDYALGSREAWYYADGTGGTYIHMNPTGYKRHAEYIAQAIYEADNSSFSQPGDVAIDTKTYYAHIGNLELGPDGIIEYEATSADGKKKTFKKDLGVKGFYSPKGDMAIYNPEANEKWNNKHDDEFNANWIEAYFEESEIGLDVTLMERAVRYLDEHREPSAQYRIQLADIPQTLSIGDTGVFIDHDYNPPLYIEARVLELTTSRTNPSQNTVLIGNVVELQPQEKGWVHTMQQGLQQMRESLHNDWINRDELTVHIKPLNSTTLTESETSAYLSVKVMRGTVDVTEYFDRFEWERMSENESDDAEYNQILSETENSSTLEVTKDDLYNNEATFTVRVYDGETLIEKSSITIKHVDTALWVDTDTPPTYAKDGATWVDESGTQWVKKDGEWEERVNQAQLFSISSEVEGAMAEAEQAKESAEQAYTDAVAEAKRSADEADDLIRTEIEQEISDVETELSTAKQEAIDATNQALADAKAHAIAQDDALSLAIQGEIDTVGAEAEQAKQDAQNAYTNAVAEAEAKVQAKDKEYKVIFGEYDSAIETIETDSQTAKTTAEQALQDVGVSNDLAQTAKDLATTAEANASQAILDASGAVTQAGQAISDAQSALSKASGAESSVSTLSSEVDTVAGKVALKAEQSEVDTISGTVSTHTSELEQHAEAISARLTSSEVSSLVDEKGLAKVTYVDGQVNATAENFGVEMARVEGKIPKNYAEENLALNSKEQVGNTNYLIKEYQLTKQLPMREEYTIVLEGGIGTDGNDQQFAIFFDGGGSMQGTLENMGGGIFRKTFTLRQTGADSGDKSHFRLYNWPRGSGKGATINWIKLVEGSDTDNTYTPPLSDLLLQNDFSVFETDFNVKAEGWDATSTYVSNNETKMNRLISNADGWENTISYVDDNQTKINQTISRVDSYQQTLGTNGENIAQLVMTDSAYQTSVRKGGRNLLRNSYGYIGNPDRAHSSFSIKDPIPHGTTVTLSFKAAAGTNQIVEIFNSNGYHRYGNVVFTKGTTQHVYHLTFTTYTHTNGGADIDINNQQIRFYNKLEPNPTAYILLQWAVLQYGEIGTEHYISDDEDFETQVTQLAGSWALNLKSGNDIKTQINATTDGIRLQSKLIHLNGSSLIDNATIKSAHIDELNANKIVGNTADFTSLRSKVITADSINANHIKADALFVDLIFANQTLVDRVWAKQIWSDKISTMKLSAGQITTGTISTERLNASDIVTKGLTTDVVEANHIKSNTALIDNIFANQALVDRLWAKDIWSNKITTMELDASQIKAGTISTARLNASDIVTSGLTTDVVTTTHIKADSALFNTLFSTTSATSRLVAQGAWIENANIKSINASKINAGTISADRISTSSLDNIEFGGRNYAQGTTDKMQYQQQVNVWSGPLADNASKVTYTLADLDAKVGDVYTASIYIGRGGGYGSGLRIDNPQGSKHRTNQVTNGYASVTFTVDSSDDYFTFYYSNNNDNTAPYKIEACKFKIEKGNKRTDWSRNPDDFGISGKVEIHGGNIKADTISADKISGGTLTGTTFLTTESSTGFSTRLANGTIEFRHQIFSLGSMNATVNASSGVVNGFAVTQRPGYIFSINSQSNLPGNNSSKPVVQVPAESTAEDRKLNIYAQGGLQLYSDVLNIESDEIIAKKPLRVNGLVASHSQTDAGARIDDAGNLMYSIDKAGSVMIHRLMVRSKAGSWPNSGLALYEDGRVAVVVKGVWKQL